MDLNYCCCGEKDVALYDQERFRSFLTFMYVKGFEFFLSG